MRAWSSNLVFLTILSVTTATLGCGGSPESRSEKVEEKAGEKASTPKLTRPILTTLFFRYQELPFLYDRGESGAAWPVETTGGGVGLLDIDGDGDLDLFFAQGVPLVLKPGSPPAPSDVLLENLGGRQFADISAKAGLTTKGYGQGVLVGDYDGDGDPDIYVTRYGRNTLWRNDGGRFVDATDEAGVQGGHWSLGASFLDYDRDGDLDLFVANYFDFNPADAPFGRDPQTGAADYGSPAQFHSQPDLLYRNDGNGHFTDVTAQAGVAGDGRGMGVLATDVDGDGLIDLFVANDAQANAVWRNKGDGTFVDVAESIGLAFNGQGKTEANMGIAFGDSNGDGLPDLFVTHFFDEHTTAWRSVKTTGGLYFQDQTNEAGIATASREVTGWGIVVADFDHDGHLDLIQSNGHLRREPGQRFIYENPPLVWQNNGQGRFVNVSTQAGPYFQALHSARGLAAGDLDGDGDIDLVVVHHHKPSGILWNESTKRGNSMVVRLKGRGGNRDAIGSKLIATVGDREISRTIDGGGSYLSSNDLSAHFGIGPADEIDVLKVRWPSGKWEEKSKVRSGEKLEWSEPD